MRRSTYGTFNIVEQVRGGFVKLIQGEQHMYLTPQQLMDLKVAVEEYFAGGEHE